MILFCCLLIALSNPFGPKSSERFSVSLSCVNERVFESSLARKLQTFFPSRFHSLTHTERSGLLNKKDKLDSTSISTINFDSRGRIHYLPLSFSLRLAALHC